MRSRIILLVGLAVAASMSSIGQVTAVTNASLETYRQERIKQEREYRANYEPLGLPSPEEIARQNEQSAKAMAELSEQLRAEELQRERLTAARAAAPYRSTSYYPTAIGSIWDNAIYGYYWNNRRRHAVRFRPRYVQPGYYAGGQFWATGSATPPRPMFAQPR